MDHVIHVIRGRCVWFLSVLMMLRARVVHETQRQPVLIESRT